MSTPPTIIMYPLNDQNIAVNGLQNGTTSAYINTDSLSATLFDATGVSVPGCINITLTYVATSNGNYTGPVVGANFNPPLGGYILKIDGPGIHVERRVSVQVRAS